MKECFRQFGSINCQNQNDGVCAFALNEALNEGNVENMIGFRGVLERLEIGHLVRIWVIHSIDLITDQEVLDRIPKSYGDCKARNDIAEAAKLVIEERYRESIGDSLNNLGRLTFGLPLQTELPSNNI